AKGEVVTGHARFQQLRTVESSGRAIEEADRGIGAGKLRIARAGVADHHIASGVDGDRAIVIVVRGIADGAELARERVDIEAIVAQGGAAATVDLADAP